MSFEVVRDPVLGEEVFLGRTDRGLAVAVAQRPAFRETVAAIGFRYGSTDLSFGIGGRMVTTPAGTAHYLEHKLFEDEELAVFQRFARRGARVNAQTGFTRTTYYFLASDHFDENLQDLLRLVSRPHITPQNVDKERGIIAQEVRMYEDAPDQCTTFDLLGCLFPEHPARHTIGGTVESIAAITPDILLQCWDAFYRTGNAALAVAGPVDPDQVLELAAACELLPGQAPQRLQQPDLGPIGTPRRERAMAVARPKVLLGIKDRTAAVGWRQRAHRAAATSVLLDRLFAASSELREAMLRRGEVDDSLGAGYLGERTFALAMVGCESDDPPRAEAALRAALSESPDFVEEHLERMRRRHIGSFVRSFESVRASAFAHVQSLLDEAPPFGTMQVLQQLTVDDVRRRAIELLQTDNLGVAVTHRAGASR